MLLSCWKVNLCLVSSLLLHINLFSSRTILRFAPSIFPSTLINFFVPLERKQPPSMVTIITMFHCRDGVFRVLVSFTVDILNDRQEAWSHLIKELSSVFVVAYKKFCWLFLSEMIFFLSLCHKDQICGVHIVVLSTDSSLWSSGLVQVLHNYLLAAFGINAPLALLSLSV